ncbi:pilus assembly protein TadG-related protein [Rhodococcus erythropolis]|uniref:Pilus assembly protein n=1 Tax=Rhodococcus erythropolis TaxID=1833 RepID=A0A8I0ZL16_RHOER|nr:pilus assembly protein TadG-related protein [Rhodococcus erythropolis]MBH5141454.1 pilus assembly protein [Rhodococcus erythropolis]
MNNLIAKLRKPEDDRGSIVLWTVIIAFGLLLCLGLVVDGGGKLHAKQQAQLVAEEAARAAGQAVITPLAARGTAVVVNPATAMIEAQKYLAATDIKGVVVPTGPNTLLITATAHYTPKVLGLIGIGEQTVVGTAHVNLNRTNTGAEAIGAP